VGVIYDRKWVVGGNEYGLKELITWILLSGL
jgi:hypothetical protein